MKGMEVKRFYGGKERDVGGEVCWGEGVWGKGRGRRAQPRVSWAGGH